MGKKKTTKKSPSVKRKKTSASIKKKRLSDQSLDWIADTTESEEFLSEQAENSISESAGKSKERKIGVLKQYVSEEAEKKEDDTPEIPPAILDSSSTIIKGKKTVPAKEEAAQKTEVMEEEKTTAVEEAPSVPDDSAEIAGEKIEDIPQEEMEKAGETKQETALEEKAREEMETVKEDLETLKDDIDTFKENLEKIKIEEEIPVEVGKTYKITEEKKLVSTKEEEKSVSGERETEPETVEYLPEYEVKKEEDAALEEEAKIEESAVYVPEESSSIVKKKAAVEKEKIEKPVVVESLKKDRKRVFRFSPISRLKNTFNGISDAFLSGLWLTGVTIGLVKGSADKVGKFIIGPIEKLKPPVAIKPSEEEDKALLNLSKDVNSVEEELTKFEQAVAKIEKRVKER